MKISPIRRQNTLKILRIILLNAAVVTGFYILTINLPVTHIMNNLFTDFLQGSIKPRNEIVVIGIDDKSLQKIGPWPWNRQIFAEVIDKINNSGASVIGIDVLFLEPREGDNNFLNSLNNSKIKVILGSKEIDSKLFKTYLESKNINNSYININTDSDGKLRRIAPYNYIAGECVESFGLTIVKEYLKITKPSDCSAKNYSLRGDNLKLANDGTLQFQYTQRSYHFISFSDILDGSADLTILKDKIVLLGSTTIDLRNNLNDNFIDVNGNTIPGILIHANIINSFLNNNFLKNPRPVYIYLFTLVISSIFLYFYLKSKNDIIYSISYFLLNLGIALTGLFLFDFNYNVPVITLILTLTLCYFYSIIYRNVSERLEKKFVAQVFSQYVNPVLLEKIVNKPELLTLGGESKEMTIMFSDIRGFTSMSEKMTPQELVQILNKYLDKMGLVIDKHNGTIDKFIGDAIMAFWNAPLDDPNHRLNAIKTALDMVDALVEFNTEHNTSFNIGIGINTGNVIVGNLGSSRRFDYTVIGDDVNLASRTEGLTKKYGINLIVIESTLDGLKNNDEFIYRQIDEVIVKGKSKPVKLYQPLRLSDSNRNLCDEFEIAFRDYQIGDFKKSLTKLETLENDGPSKLLIDRIKNTPNLKEQKGIWKWEEK